MQCDSLSFQHTFFQPIIQLIVGSEANRFIITLQPVGGSHGVILDNCIPTHGVTHWMEKSNCLLLKEKSAYNDLYSAVNLVSINIMYVYL